MFSILTFMGLYLIPKHHNLMLIATMKLVKRSETRTPKNNKWFFWANDITSCRLISVQSCEDWMAKLCTSDSLVILLLSPSLESLIWWVQNPYLFDLHRGNQVNLSLRSLVRKVEFSMVLVHFIVIVVKAKTSFYSLSFVYIIPLSSDIWSHGTG